MENHSSAQGGVQLSMRMTSLVKKTNLQRMTKLERLEEFFKGLRP